MKRKFISELSQKSPTKRITRSDKWVSATQLRNFILNDGLVDYLKCRNKPSESGIANNSGNKFSDYIKKYGIEFENSIVKYLSNKFSITTVSPFITDETVEKVKELIKNKTPIIHSAPFRNHKNKTRGVIDLLVRADYINKIVPNSIKAEEITNPEHYYVIDIKFSTLPIRSDGIHLLNSDAFPAYKSQLLIYNQALEELQGYSPCLAFILGRRFTFIKNNVKYNSLNCFEKLGRIDYKDIDFEYLQKTEDAIKWVRDVNDKWGEWSVSPPSREELYPNMNIDSGEWNQEKEKISDDIGEITKLWYCGVRERKHALVKGISSWRDDRCNSSVLGITGNRARIIDEIISINKQSRELIRPLKIIPRETRNILNHSNEVYVDFETILDIFSPLDELPIQRKTEMIFMIGIYYSDSIGYMQYKSFIADSLTNSGEYMIMNQFLDFLKSLNNPNIWYWHAEPNIWNRAIIRNPTIQTNVLIWKDLCKIFREEPIVIKDCFNFSLKSIVKAMNKHSLIPTKITSDCDSGICAAVKAFDIYKNDPGGVKTNTVMLDIEKYNRFDVEALYDILNYIRNNLL